VILNAVKEINRKSGKVVLCSLNDYVKEIFEENCGNNVSITIAESIDSGLKALLNPLNAT
jgi:hypothetical protein